MTDSALNGPHNQLGEPATTTTRETVARLQEKASRSHGGANRERISARIAGRMTNARAMSLQLPRRGFEIREAPREARTSGARLRWLLASIVLVGAVMWTRR